MATRSAVVLGVARVLSVLLHGLVTRYSIVSVGDGATAYRLDKVTGGVVYLSLNRGFPCVLGEE